MKNISKSIFLRQYGSLESWRISDSTLQNIREGTEDIIYTKYEYKQRMAWINPASRVPLEKLIFRQFVTKVQAFYGKQPSTLWVNKRLPHVSILNQINSVHDLQPYLFNIHFNNILPPTRRFSRWSNSFRFRDRKYVSISLLPHTCHMLRSPHSPWFHHQKKCLVRNKKH